VFDYDIACDVYATTEETIENMKPKNIYIYPPNDIYLRDFCRKCVSLSLYKIMFQASTVYSKEPHNQ